MYSQGWIKDFPQGGGEFGREAPAKISLPLSLSGGEQIFSGEGTGAQRKKKIE